MRFLLLAILLVLPPLAFAQSTLDSPAHNSIVSGLGFIAGWKCNAGTITVRLNDGGSITVAAHQPRADTHLICGTINNGFILQANWNHLGAGQHTIVAYDDEVEFARHTFTVGSTGEEFLPNVDIPTVIVPGFPAPGETGHFVWNTSTQHLELREVTVGAVEPAEDIPVLCRVHTPTSAVWHTPGGIRHCLEAGADPNIRDQNSGATPLHIAAGQYEYKGPWIITHYENPESVRLLLAAGADPDIQDVDGHTPVHVASWEQSEVQVETLRLLLEAGASPNIQDEDGRTPLDIALRFGSPEKVRLLLSFGAQNG